VRGRNEELDVSGGCVAGLEFATANDGIRAEFARLAVGGRLEFGGRQQDRNNEERQAEDGRDPAAPEAQRKNDERSAETAERDAQQGPGLLIAMKAKELRGSLEEQKERCAKNALSTLKKVFLIGGDDCRCRAHGSRTRYCTS